MATKRFQYRYGAIGGEIAKIACLIGILEHALVAGAGIARVIAGNRVRGLRNQPASAQGTYLTHPPTEDCEGS